MPTDGAKTFTQVFCTINGQDEEGNNDPVLNGTVSAIADNGRFVTFQANDEDLRTYNETHSGPEMVVVNDFIDATAPAVVAAAPTSFASSVLDPTALAVDTRVNTLHGGLGSVLGGCLSPLVAAAPSDGS